MNASRDPECVGYIKVGQPPLRRTPLFLLSDKRGRSQGENHQDCVF